jgi:hypothetical protein
VEGSVRVVVGGTKIWGCQSDGLDTAHDGEGGKEGGKEEGTYLEGGEGAVGMQGELAGDFLDDLRKEGKEGGKEEGGERG